MNLMPPACEGSEHETNAMLFHGSLQRLTMIICSYSTTELVLSPAARNEAVFREQAFIPAFLKFRSNYEATVKSQMHTSLPELQEKV